MSNGSTDPDEGTGTTESASTRADDQPDRDQSDGDQASEPTPTGVEETLDEGSTDVEEEPFDGIVEGFNEPTTGRADATLEISTDKLFELLSSPGNRFVLTYLIRVENPASRDDFVEYVVDRADPPDGLTEGKFRGRVATQLVHSTFPKLADAGLVDVDDEAGTVAATAGVESVAPYLALAISQSEFRDS